ncbi:MAG: hypothetical protein HUU50_11770 [Candidatus Brocadiae bacterium]|nr:hypothetical protein [Candidatus Brocadiia bacterium]
MEFEGPEKKLEIVLKQPRVDLRGNVDGRWDRVVKSAHTQILSSVSNPWFDAYLLSESSLFVYPDRIILITCGGSRPFEALPTVLEFINPSEIRYIFYERKNFLYPEAQICDFQVETEKMNELFPGQQWLIGEESKDHIYFFFTAGQNVICETPKVHDTTLEILMHDISEDVAQLFYDDSGVTTEILRYRSGIEFLVEAPEIIYNDYLFHPCGYSLNAMVNEGYFTIHITPQSVCSYVSFETNINLSNPSRLLQKVLDCFSPKRFTFVVTSNSSPVNLRSKHTEGYRKTIEKTVSIGHGYKVHLRNYHYQDCFAKVLV